MHKTLKTFIFGVVALLVLSIGVAAQKGQSFEKRVKVPKGKTRLKLKGYIATRLDTNEFLMHVRAGQILTVVYASEQKGGNVCIFSMNNRDLCGRQKYSFRAAETGDYRIMVDSKRDNLRYLLTISIK